MAEAKNVILLVPLPEEFRGRTFGVDWSTDWELLQVEGRPKSSLGKPYDWIVGLDEQNYQARLEAPSLSPGKTIYFLLEYPEMSQQGYNVNCTVYVDNQKAAQETKRIAP